MFPTIPIGPLRLQTFGLFLLAAYFAGLWLAARQARRHGIDGDHIYNAGFYALIVGLVAARLGHVVAYVEVYRTDPLQVLSLSPGAFLLLPGLLGALAMVAIYLRRHRLPAAAMADVFAPGVLLGLAIGEVGAFLAGRGLGGVSTLPLAIEQFGVRRHPVALLDALATLALLVLLLWVDRKHAPQPGRLALMALFGYAIVVLFLEPLRAASPTVGAGWRLPQVVALLVIAACGWLLGKTEPRAAVTSLDPT
jgi:phosphatidylglycerol:prolipoprotein diacylglycerol transferase